MRNFVIQNGLWNAFSHVIGIVTGIFGSILIVNNLTAAGYAQFSYYIWLAGILSLLGTLSLPNAITKVTSELQGDRQQAAASALSNSVLLLVVGLNLLLAAGILLWSFTSHGIEYYLLIAVAVILVPGGLAAVARSTLWGQQRYRPVTLISSIASLVQLGLIVVVAMYWKSALGFVLAMLSAQVVQSIGLVWILTRNTTGTPLRLKWVSPQRTIWKRYSAFALPYSLVLIFEVIVWQRSEIFFLSQFSNVEQIGFYNLAYTFFGMFLALGWALINSYYPAISHDYGASAWSEIQDKFIQGTQMAFLFAVPIGLGSWVVADSLIVLLYGSHMAPAIPVARILLFGLPFGTLAAMMALTVSSIGGIWIHVKLGVFISIVNIALDLLLIPPYGAVGAAAANTAAQLVNTVALIVIIQRNYQIAIPWLKISHILLIGVCTTWIGPRIIQVWTDQTFWGVSTVILLSGLSYTILILWTTDVRQSLLRTSASTQAGSS